MGRGIEVQRTGGQHSLNIICDVTEDSSIALGVIWLRRQWFYLNTLNDRLLELRLRLVENRTRPVLINIAPLRGYGHRDGKLTLEPRQ